MENMYIKQSILENQNTAKITLGLFLIFITWLYFTDNSNYLLFHSAAELFTVIIAGGIFIIAWNAHRFMDNHYLVFLGIAYFFIAIIDVAHLLAFKGMGVFASIDPGANLATQLWIAARYLQGATLLLAPIFLTRKIKLDWAFAIYTLATAALLLSIFYFKIFPIAYVDGIGLTLFKKISEYAISAVFAASAIFLYLKRQTLQPRIAKIMIWSIAITIASELAFTLYVDVYGYLNLAGHLLKILAFYLIYKAIIKTSLANPYESLFLNLKQKEEALSGALKQSQGALESLKISDELYQDALTYTQSIIDTVRQPLIVLKENLKIDSANRSFYDLFQTTPEETEGKFIYELDNECWSNPEIKKYLEQAVSRNKRFYGLEIQLTLPKIKEAILSFSASPIKRPGAHSALILLSISNITDYRKTELELAHLASFPRLNPTPIIELEANGHITYLNPAAKVRFPDLSELESKHPFLAEWAPLADKARSEKSQSLSRDIVVGDGWFEQTISYLPSSQNFRIYSREITERKKAEEKIIRAKEEWEKTFNSLPDLIAILDKQHRFVQINKAMAERLGITQEECVGLNCFKCVHKAKKPPAFCPHSLTLADGKEHVAEIHEDSLNGDFLISTTPLFDASGRMTGSVHVARDITARKKREEELLKLKLGIERSGEAIFITDVAGTFIYINEAFEKTYGYTKKETIGENPRILKSGTVPPENYEKFWEKILSKQTVIEEIVNKTKDGRLITVHSSTNPIVDEGGKIIGFLAIQRDITESKAIEQAKSEFISLAAHQLRTPLATISLTSEMLLRGLAGKLDRGGRKYLQDIYHEIQSMSEMIEIFLNVSRIEMGTFPVEPKPTNLIETVDNIITEILPQIKSKQLKLKKSYERTLPAINIDRRIIRIVLENLLSNAIKYTDEGGKIGIAIRKENSEVIIEVSDNGCGIPKNQQAKVFDKMYRAGNTGRVKEGVGLGLYVVKSAIEQSNGRVWFESEKNKGTTFYIAIPLDGMKKRFDTRVPAAAAK